MKTLLGDQSIADILLVWSEFRPAALVEISYLPQSTISRLKFHRTVHDLEEILRKLTPWYQLKLNYPKGPGELTQYSCIAKDQSTLRKLIAASVEKNIKKRRRQLGALLGYPKTAIVAFANGKTFDLHKLPPAIFKKIKDIKFLNFRLSRHWREELKYIEKRAKEIKKISPELHRRIAS